MLHPVQTITDQFANSPVILQLVENFGQYFSPSANIEQFFNLIWNIETAEGRGLTIWGEIVNVGNVVTIEGFDPIGFEQGGPTYTGVDQGPFQIGSNVTENFQLTDDAYRQVILAKALFNICNGSTQAINQILLNLFPNRGNCYVVDNLDMSMTYKFDFVLTLVEQAIVAQSGVLPRSTGVSYDVVSAT